MAEGLQDEPGREAHAGEILHLVARHRPGRVLRADRRHPRLAVGAGTHALAFGQAAGATDDLLRQRIALAGVGWLCGHAEQRRRRQAEGGARFRGQVAAHDQRNAPSGLDLIEDHIRLDLEFSDDLAVLQRLAFEGAKLDHIARLHFRDVELDRQRARIFHGVEEDRRDLAAEAHAAKALVRHVGDVFAGPPQHRVRRGFARGAGADHVACIGDEVAFLLQRLQELDRANLAGLVRLDAGARDFSASQAHEAECPGGSRRRARAKGRPCSSRPAP